MFQALRPALLRLASALLVLTALAPPTAAQDDAAGDAWWPDWFRVDGTLRLRYERIQDQYRASPALAEDDQLLLSRTQLDMRADFDGVDTRVELMDSRQALASDSTPAVNTSAINTTDVLQAYVDFDLGRLGQGEHRLRLGRETLTLGSRRLVHRNGYRNTINSFNGVDWLRSGDEGRRTRAFWLLPTRIRPYDRASIQDNEHDWDSQSSEIIFAGVHHTEPVAERTELEAFVFELRETDAGTRRRRLTSPGLRLLRTPAAGEWGYELEGVYQFGHSRLATGGPDLDHSAWLGRLSGGYRFEDGMDSRLYLSLDYLTGDRTPGDGENQRFDPLFGPGRFDFGPTNLWNAFRRSNLVSPELRWSFAPCEDTKAFLAWRVLELEEETDAWVSSGWADPMGASGDDLGQQVEFRVRTDVIPGQLQLELGGAHLWAGSYVDNLSGGTRGDDSSFVYSQATWRF